MAQGAKQILRGSGVKVDLFVLRVGQSQWRPQNRCRRCSRAQATILQRTMEATLEKLFTRLGTLMPPGGDSGGLSLDERRSRAVGKSQGHEGTWPEWSATTKESVVALHAFAPARESDIEVDQHSSFTHPQWSLCWRSAEEVVRLKDITEESSALVLKLMNLGTVKKTQYVLVQGWESWVRTLKRDHTQDVADTARVGLLIMMAPDELQGTIFDHAGRSVAEQRAVQ